MGLTNHMSTWAANFHKEFLKKPNKRLRNFSKPISIEINHLQGAGKWKSREIRAWISFLKESKNFSVSQSFLWLPVRQFWIKKLLTFFFQIILFGCTVIFTRSKFQVFISFYSSRLIFIFKKLSVRPVPVSQVAALTSAHLQLRLLRILLIKDYISLK